MFLEKTRLSMSGFFVIGVLVVFALLLTPYAPVAAQEVETDLDAAEVEPLLDNYCNIALAFSVDPMLEVAVRYSSGAARWFDEQCDLFIAPPADLMEDAASRNSADAARWLAGDYEVQGFAPAPNNEAANGASVSFTAEVIDLMDIAASRYSAEAARWLAYDYEGLSYSPAPLTNDTTDSAEYNTLSSGHHGDLRDR